MLTEFKERGYIDNENGDIITNGEWKYTDFIDISKMKSIGCECNQENSLDYNAFYDEQFNFVGKFTIENEVVVPVGKRIKYARFSIRHDKNLIIFPIIDTLESKLEKPLSEYGLMPKKYIVKFEYSGYVNNIDGSFVDFPTWKRTGWIQLDNNRVIYIKSSQTDNTQYNAIYDKNSKFIKSIKQNEKIYLPSNAKYMIISVRTEHNAEAYNLFDDADILYLNKDIEPNIIQASSNRSLFFNDTKKVLTFIHLSDVHRLQDLWDRMIKFANYYNKYIKFAIHTGDYVGASQQEYSDLYDNGIEHSVPIYNVIGNHDVYVSYPDKTISAKSIAYNYTFNHKDNWNATFMDGNYSMTYYVDFVEENTRLIVLDNYYDQDAQVIWLTDVLNSAKSLGYHVITAMHEVSNPIVTKLNTSFQTITNFESKGGNQSTSPFDIVIANFKASGGVHICNLVGHEHSDMIGFTKNGVLNVVVECAAYGTNWNDGRRIAGTRTYDCFNIVSVDTNTNLLKITRVGDNVDLYMRHKTALCYDYKNKSIISSY